MSTISSLNAAARRVEILHEALPYIQRFAGKTIVIKYGGHAMVDPLLKQGFARDVVLLKQIGINPVIVHGGGPQIEDLLDKLGIQSTFVHGRRVTDAATMDVVEMVLVGKVNKEIVNMIQMAGGKCVGLSGKDGGLILGERLKIEKAGTNEESSEMIDLGKAGTVTRVDPRVIEAVEASGFIAVIAPVGRSADGETLNINADTVAGAVAGAENAEKLILMTDVNGVKVAGKWVKTMSIADAKKAMNNGDATGGMIPKLECAIDAIERGVRRVHILDGRVPNAILLEMFTDDGIGSMIGPELPLVFRD